MPLHHGYADTVVLNGLGFLSLDFAGGGVFAKACMTACTFAVPWPTNKHCDTLSHRSGAVRAQANGCSSPVVVQLTLSRTPPVRDNCCATAMSPSLMFGTSESPCCTWGHIQGQSTKFGISDFP